MGFISDGDEYFAFVADRRPLAVGQEPVITPVPYNIDGALIEVFVDAGVLDDLAEFGWRYGSHTLHGPLETEGFQNVDTAPNERVWVVWSAN